jgi:hypothetical protein
MSSNLGGAMISQNDIYHARILIVDDQPVNVELLEYLLSPPATRRSAPPPIRAWWPAGTPAPTT